MLESDTKIQSHAVLFVNIICVIHDLIIRKMSVKCESPIIWLISIGPGTEFRVANSVPHISVGSGSMLSSHFGTRQLVGAKKAIAGCFYSICLNFRLPSLHTHTLLCIHYSNNDNNRMTDQSRATCFLSVHPLAMIFLACLNLESNIDRSECQKVVTCS